MYSWVQYLPFAKLNSIGSDYQKATETSLPLKYAFRFMSFVPPGSSSKMSLMNRPGPHSGPQQHSEHRSNRHVPKISVKDSYMMASWMSYIKNLSKTSPEKATKKNLPSIFVYPPRTKKFTHTKAPMAHKTFSQEQFKFKFYFMSATFTSFADSAGVYTPDSVNKSIYAALAVRQTAPNIFLSNLLILKRVTFLLPAEDNLFLNSINLR